MYPEKSLANEATLSAMPSMTPNCAGPAPIDARNAGRTQYAISLAVSFRNEVAPKAIRLWEPRASLMEILYHRESSGRAEGFRSLVHGVVLGDFPGAVFVFECDRK